MLKLIKDVISLRLISVLLFSISSNLDNLIIGAAYGMKKAKITLLYNFIIAMVTYISTFLAMALGKFICYFLSAGVANILGSLILILIGVSMIFSDFRKAKAVDSIKNKQDINSINSSQKNNICYCEEILDNPMKITEEVTESITIKEVFCLALALALNNVAIGVSASITGLSILFTSTCTFIFSMVSVALGYYLGKKFLSDFLGKYTSIISGVIIIVLGIYELFI